MGSSFWCKKCGYKWKSKKRDGRPAICPRCNSKKIVWDMFRNNEQGLMISIIMIAFFIVSIFIGDKSMRFFGNFAGWIGIPLLLILIFNSLEHHKKNKRIMKQFS